MILKHLIPEGYMPKLYKQQSKMQTPGETYAVFQAIQETNFLLNLSPSCFI
jgi:hypothetical protein